MTEAQAAWLRKLRDEGPHEKAPRGNPGIVCSQKSYMRWDPIARVWRITNAGLAALAEHEEPQP